MKKIKLFSLIAYVVCSLITMQVNAQETVARQQNPQAHAKEMANKLTKQLQLTEDQQTKVYDIALKYANRTAEVSKGDMGTNKAGMMDKMDAEIQAVLTDEQYRKYKEMEKEKKAKSMPSKTKEQNKTQSRMGVD